MGGVHEQRFKGLEYYQGVGYQFMCQNLDLRFLFFYYLLMFAFFFFYSPFVAFFVFQFFIASPLVFLLPFLFHLCFSLFFGSYEFHL
jgi:hypothetical protein